jgi:hypothetical protein
MPSLLEDFVTAASLDGLDTECLRRLQGDAFFVDLLGPPP